MPIEDATVEWPETQSPYLTVARIVAPAQNAFSDARVAYFNEALAFRPAHSLAAHRPIGSIMRARLAVYGAISRLRHARSGTPELEPRSLSEVPR
jgi:hypothetical protein